MSDSERRAEWTSAATDYALEHGLIGLSLRPLAADLGTSDRMLLYHFGSKDELVAAILRHSNDRSGAYIAAMPPSKSLRSAVFDIWDVVTAGTIGQCSRLYVEAAALGLLGREPYATVVREANDRGYDCLIPEDCVGSYFPEFQEMGLKMIKAQGGIFGWVTSSPAVITAIGQG